MKRSEVNDILRQGTEFIQSFGFHLPSFAYWTPDQIRHHAVGSDLAKDRMGWDLTYYGQVDFATLDLFCFT